MFFILGYGTIGFLPFYWLGPRAARLGREYGFVTQAELVAHRFRRPSLALIMALISLVAFVPYLSVQIRGAGHVVAQMSGERVSVELGAAIVYAVASSPADGRLELASAPGVAVASFTQADVDAGRVVYVHGGGGAGADAFSFTVRDAGSPASAPATFSLEVLRAPFVVVGVDRAAVSLPACPIPHARNHSPRESSSDAAPSWAVQARPKSSQGSRRSSARESRPGS